MKSITVQELVSWREEGVSHVLIDIREAYEREVSHIDGVHIPMEDVLERLGEIPKSIILFSLKTCRTNTNSRTLETVT